MLKIVSNRVYLTKGDTAKFDIVLDDSPGMNQEYVLSDADKVYFIVTRDPVTIDIDELDTPSSCIFYKTGRSITIEPEDTENLEYGTYYYHVRVILAEGGYLNTIIEPEDFILTPDRNWW